MMIKITERCTMGCKHCMNDAKPDGHGYDCRNFRRYVEFSSEI